MSQEFIIEIAERTIYYTAVISAPVLITGLIVGLFVSIFQTVSNIREMTLTFIPKITSVMLVLLVALPWMMNKFIEYFNYLMNIMAALR
ncbi:MAG: flagellar biosynthetic protein FliQ [Candidatus Cloacimonadota bacterium]|nr:MAG: flagellar biosynthetic protein FliQ [Candidatus Cloacimonadota bacterium]